MATKKQPTMTIDEYGDKVWRLKNGQYHREDGPAIEYADGTKFWFLNGKRHRKDGPAIEYASGYKAWYINGEELTEDEHANQMFIKWCTTPVEYTG